MKFLKHTVWSLIVASMMTACMGFDEINVDPDKMCIRDRGRLPGASAGSEYAPLDI